MDTRKILTIVTHRDSRFLLHCFKYFYIINCTKIILTVFRLGQSVKLMIAVAIFFTYSLQFYVPMEIIWNNVRHLFGARKNIAEYSIRVILVILTLCTSIAIPNLGPFISLVGALCLSFLGLIFPAIIETVTFWDRPNGLGRFNWVLWKNMFLVSFGILGFLTGSYVSILDIISGKE